MKKYIATILFLFCFLGIKTTYAKEYGTSAPLPTDQANFPPPAEMAWGGNGSTNKQYIGQEFKTQSTQTTMDGIEIYMKVENGCPSSPTYDLALSLFQGYWNNTSVLIASAEMSYADCQEILNTGYVWYEFLFPETLTVSPATRYHLRLYSGDHTDGDRYTNGKWDASYLANAGYYYYSSAEGEVKSDYEIAFRTFTGRPQIQFEITDPTQGQMKIKDTWITISGTCITDGSDRIAFTNDCSDFTNLDYTVDCIDNAFSGQFYYNGISDWVVAVDINSQAHDCVDYDNLMDVVSVHGIEVIEGYPDDWYFNYDYYSDFDIIINSPAFVDALTLPIGTANTDISFKFIYPTPLSPNVTFNVKQYDENGNLLNANYHGETLINMADTNNYIVNFTASTSPLHYVVQLFNGSELVRQFPFGIYVSDLDFTHNPDDYKFFFPRLVEKLRQKIIFNYFFGFYDSFYNLFSATGTPESAEALDISFVAMSDDGQYDLEVPILKGSDPSVKSFAQGMRPYIIAFLWIGFAVYVFLRVAKMFESDE
ncbi:hypothetical protein A2531_01770 [Candidatus Falkowbacteria bacterium RIFOXYD2_FULL_34_120]|uniref:Uncharacterized protein n=1 Tax=Candidatus Falkowbacteria bacterium RIFOXYD2_FULL_34_120 TaxID=1798007 RepID=A0A1F5TM45_9BACT|nr:MAG: hypothetical protein A2500_05850 [Candidatus Falkowbacteria bacterium RIFOXYC12_FULL_34_55]OGF38700.1 MAG: hypothetical protein A2515_01515 [Candidatus Falkowbacteria bacterium RIFOXYD12_FULL_34_57]OGF39934.1 MAG: hypothetical protein A2531_01770 [Candidatus Falkowbacteria bacterium RIFOXYD2_FULL_34_120]